MSATAAGNAWLAEFPALSQLSIPDLALLQAGAQSISAPAGTVLFQPGDACSDYLFVVAGSVRVHQNSESGREIVLYRVGAGQTCILTTACLLGNTDYAAAGMVEEEVSAIVLRGKSFRALMESSEVFRSFIFSVWATRLSGLMQRVEEVAFGHVDTRLAQCLLERMNDAGEVTLSHRELAVELGTAREVVSRQLKEFERSGWLRLRRRRIDLIEPAPLRELLRAR